jgi:hypothetical protein
MSVLRMILKTWATGLCLLFALSVVPALASSHGSPPKDPAASTSKKKMNSRKNASSKDQLATAVDSGSAQAPGAPAKLSSTASAGGPVSAAEIAAAKSSHKVWVNLNSGIYHKRGRWYGKTKNGKFITEDEAKKAGYRHAKRD